MKAGGAVVVHCNSGHHRAPQLCAAMMAALENTDYPTAKQALLRLRPSAEFDLGCLACTRLISVLTFGMWMLFLELCVVSKFVTPRSKKGKGKGKTGKDKITFEDLVKDNVSELRRILQ